MRKLGTTTRYYTVLNVSWMGLDSRSSQSYLSVSAAGTLVGNFQLALYSTKHPGLVGGGKLRVKGEKKIKKSWSPMGSCLGARRNGATSTSEYKQVPLLHSHYTPDLAGATISPVGGTLPSGSTYVYRLGGLATIEPAGFSQMTTTEGCEG